MYAIIFGIDTNFFEKEYHGISSTNAYVDIRKFMEDNGFDWVQGGVYFGKDDEINSVTCVTVVQRLAQIYPWFSACVKDIRMLRIEENSDLLPAILFS